MSRGFSCWVDGDEALWYSSVCLLGGAGCGGGGSLVPRSLRRTKGACALSSCSVVATLAKARCSRIRSQGWSHRSATSGGGARTGTQGGNFAPRVWTPAEAQRGRGTGQGEGGGTNNRAARAGRGGRVGTRRSFH